MKFFDRNRAKSGNRYLTPTDRELAEALGIELEGISSNKAKEATFFTCLRILSDTVSKLPLKLMQETGEGTKKAVDHYLYKKLKLRPNKNMSASDFWKTVEYQRNYYGHSVVVIETLPNGKVNALHPLDMKNTEIWIDDARTIGKEAGIWYVYRYNGKEYLFKSDEVLHFKGLTPDGVQGMAVKDYLITTVENLQFGAEYVNKYFKGGLSAKGILHYTGDMKDEAVNRMRERFEKMATGMNNVGRILPLPIGFSFATMNSTMADAQFFELNQLTIRQIAAAFGIKPHMLGDMTNAKYNNVQSQYEEFYRDTLLPIFTMYEQELTYKLLTDREVDSGYFFQFNVNAILRVDLKTRYEAYSIGHSNGFLTANEIRRMEDLPTMEGGDTLIVNGSYQPLQDVGMAYRTKEDNSLNRGDNQDEE